MHVEFSHNKAIIKWKPKDGEAKLQRSEAPHDGFEEVDTIDLSTGEYIDDLPVDDMLYYYYKIGDKLAYINDVPNGYAKEIIRRDKWFLDKERYSGGNKAIIFMRRVGNTENCPVCYDEIKQKVVRTNCPECNGSGVLNAFYRPLEIPIDMRPSRRTRALRFEKISPKTYQNSFWTTNIPLIKPDDIIVFQANRYRVSNDINYTRLGDYITKQNVPIEVIEQHQTQYRLDTSDVLKWDEFNVKREG